MKCQIYWGSHGCGLPHGHEGVHRCNECSEFEATETPEYDPQADFIDVPGRVRYQYSDGGWSEWMENSSGFWMP